MDTSPVTEKIGPQRSRNDKNGRRGWSTSEEEVLANGMLKIVREGWRSENGFKTGYLNVLELYLNKHIPNCKLKADPHINSRITVWKRHYNSLSDMLGTTGVGCDWKSKLVEATDDQWDAWMKKDSNAKNIRNKNWPLYEKWCEIFGTTRATGEGACDHIAADKQPSGVGGENIPSTTNVDNTAESESHTDGVQMAESSGVKNKTVGKKRKNMPASDPFIDVMNSFVQTASTRLGEIAHRIGYEQDMSTARKKIFEFVQSIDCLTRNEKLRVSSLKSRNPENLDVFFSLPEDDRVEWTLMVLRGEV